MTEYLEIPWFLRKNPNEARREMEDQTRNLNPHKPARVAMYLYGEAYAAQCGGSMDFWDRLPESRKNVCRKLVAELADAPDEQWPECSGDPACCPENEGRGCCKPNST